MRSGFWIFLLFGLLFLVHNLLKKYPPQEWRDYAIGRFYFFQRDRGKAEQEFDKAVENSQGKSGILIEIGKHYLSVKDWEKGEKFIRQAVNILPSPETYYLLGQCLYMQGKLEEAETNLQKAMELDPTNPYVLNDLGYIWVEQDKNLEKAVQMLETAIKKVRSPEVLDSLGWAYVKTGKIEDGLKLLKKAVEGSPYNYELRYHLAIAYAKLGKKPFARVELKKAELLLNKAEANIREEKDAQRNRF